MHTAVLGTQWGDEGKGKIIDYLAKEHDIIVRCQGGNNAGHTVVVNGRKFAFHLLPSAVLYPNKTCVLGNGMVINPEALVEELDLLESVVGKEHAKILISDRAHIITPEHIESDKSHGKKIGTTGRGIGPAYTDKVSRKGIRYHSISELDFISPSIKERIAPLIADTAKFLYAQIRSGKKLLFEGAQATMLDIDHGTYPYVTSSNCTIGGIFTGSGIFTKEIKIVGVAKAYTTRVGEGPFPTELQDEIGELLRSKGEEYGTTTGRPRKCGWLDTVILRYAKRINGLDVLALTKLDTLTGIPEIKICNSYNCGKIKEIPADVNLLSAAVPHYVEVSGWREDISKCRTFNELPQNARDYVKRIEDLVEIKIEYIGVGPEREQMIEIF